MRLHHFSIRENSRYWRRFARVHRNSETGGDLLDMRLEYCIFSGASHTGIDLSFDDESAGLQLFVGLAHVLDAWVAVGSPSLSSAIYRRFNKSLPDVHIADLRLHDRAIWWEIWHSKWEHRRETPRWRSGNFHWWDWLTGKPVYASEIIDGPHITQIPMPEGAYLAEITMSHDTWKRARWPWPQVRSGYDIKVISRPGPDGPYDPHLTPYNGYIPVPGKGENSWDCGADGTFAQSGSARNAEEAIGQVVASVLRDRKRRGVAYDYAEPIS